MTTPKSVKTASVISLIFIGAWLLVVILIYIFQDNIINLYTMTSFVGENKPIFLASTVVNIISVAIVAVCNVLMINEKTALVPFVLSGAATLLNPVFSNLAYNVQFVLVGKTQGMDYLQRLTSISQFIGYTSYILNIAFFCTVAASSIYAYVRKKS